MIADGRTIVVDSDFINNTLSLAKYMLMSGQNNIDLLTAIYVIDSNDINCDLDFVSHLNKALDSNVHTIYFEEKCEGSNASLKVLTVDYDNDLITLSHSLFD